MDEYTSSALFLYNMKLKQNEAMIKGLKMTLRDLKKQYEIKETAELHKDIITINDIIATATENHNKGYPWLNEKLDEISNIVEPIKKRHL
eukprot:g20855.t1